MASLEHLLKLFNRQRESVGGSPDAAPFDLFGQHRSSGASKLTLALTGTTDITSSKLSGKGGQTLLPSRLPAPFRGSHFDRRP